MPVRTSPKRRTHAGKHSGSARTSRGKAKGTRTAAKPAAARTARPTARAAARKVVARLRKPVSAKATAKAKAKVRAPEVKRAAPPRPVERPAPLALVPPLVARRGTNAVGVEIEVARPVARVPREQLLERYTPLVKYVVERLAVGLPKNVDHAD